MAKVKAPALSPQDQQASAILAIAAASGGADLASADASGLVNVTGVSTGVVNLPAGEYSGQTIIVSNITAVTTFKYNSSAIVGDSSVPVGVGLLVWYFSASGTGLWYSVGA